MFALTEISRNTQRALSMLMSAVIIFATLSLGAYDVNNTLHRGYSVTVTQIQ